MNEAILEKQVIQLVPKSVSTMIPEDYEQGKINDCLVDPRFQD
jgi:hypothetical protein